MIAGCYTLHLYCDNYTTESQPFPDEHGHAFKEFPHEYTHELGTECRRMARKAGWLIRADGYALCPKCSGKKRS